MFGLGLCNRSGCRSSRHNSRNCRGLGKHLIVVDLSGATSAATNSLLLVLNGTSLDADECEVLHALRELVNDNLLGAPSETEASRREPEAGNLGKHGDLCILRKEVLDRRITVRLPLGVVELRLELAVELAELELVRRRVRLRVALLIERKLHTRLVIVANGVNAALLAEPRLAVLVSKRDDMLIERSEHLVIPVNRAGGVIITLEAEINRIVNARPAKLRLVIDAEPVRERHILRSLEDELAAVIVDIRLLGAAVENTGIRGSNLRGREVGGSDDSVGHLGGLGLVPYPAAAGQQSSFWAGPPSAITAHIFIKS